MRYEVFTLGKHFLQIHTSKGFTLFANAKLNSNHEVVSYTDKLVRRGGTWVIDTWKFLTIKYFPENPIYCAVFGFEDDDTEVKVNATDIDVDSISGVNGQLVDIGNISLEEGQALAISPYSGIDSKVVRFTYEEYQGAYKFSEETIRKLHSLGFEDDRRYPVVSFPTNFRFDMPRSSRIITYNTVTSKYGDIDQSATSLYLDVLTISFLLSSNSPVASGIVIFGKDNIAYHTGTLNPWFLKDNAFAIVYHAGKNYTFIF